MFDPNFKALNKEQLIRLHINQMLNRIANMFEYRNLPKTIPRWAIERITQLEGFSIWAKDNSGDLYVFGGSLGGVPSPYYMPTEAIVTNPALKLNKTYNIYGEKVDCVIMPNDDYYTGVLPLFTKYAYMLAEAEISLKRVTINLRAPVVIQGDNESSILTGKQFFEDIEKGEKLGVISTKSFMDGLTTKPIGGNSQAIKDLIEEIQYLKASWLIDLGVNAAYNMKREVLSAAETIVNDDVLMPTIFNMLDNRKKSVERINELFGTAITVDFSSVWAENEKERKIELEAKEQEVSNDTKEINRDADG